MSIIKALGCLSVGGYRAIVPRATKVVVSGLDRNGEKISINADGWLARIVQHEVDHLNGHLYIPYIKAGLADLDIAVETPDLPDAKLARSKY